MLLKSYFSFFFKNYFRSHRYLREILLTIIFNVFFWGFLYSDKPEDTIWTVFGVFGLLLTMVTVPSVFYLEKKNSVYFTLVRKSGRRNFFFSKILLIFIIDFILLAVFTLLYGLRFLNAQYFLLLSPRLLLISILLILSILILSLSFSYKPWIVWLIIFLIVFGGILNKAALLPLESLKEFYKLIAFFLPPFLEIIYTAVTLDFNVWHTIFIIVALIHIIFYLFLNEWLIQRKDFI